MLITVTGADKPGVTSALFEVAVAARGRAAQRRTGGDPGPSDAGRAGVLPGRVAEGALRDDVESAIREVGLDVSIERSDDVPIIARALDPHALSCWAGRSPPAFGAVAREAGGAGRQHRPHPRCLRLPGDRPGVAGFGAAGRRRDPLRTALTPGGRRGARRRRGRAPTAWRDAPSGSSCSTSTRRWCRARSSRCWRRGRAPRSKVAAITDAAMRGELDFAQSLRPAGGDAGGSARIVIDEVADAAGADARRAHHDTDAAAAWVSAAAWCPGASARSSSRWPKS